MENAVMQESRELLIIPDGESTARISEALLHALSGEGPAIATTPISQNLVPKKVALALSTTGSTGIPKEIFLSTKALIASARAAHRFLDARPGDRWSLLLPLTHIAGINVLVRSLELGTEVIDLRNSGRLIDADFTAIVPTQLFRALKGDSSLLAHLKNAKAVLVGGASADNSLLEEALSAGINVVTTYGMSETTGGCVYNHKPLDGVSVRINDEGLIEIKGDVLAYGLGKWFTTSDLGEIRGNELHFLGRADDVINSGGEKISLFAVEEVLHSTFPNQRFIAFALPHSEWGEALALASDSDFDEEVIAAKLKNSLGYQYGPKYFFRWDEIPSKGIGKPDRIMARDRALNATRKDI
jgi:o-succinylbenzoate---CoA ligase